MSDIFSNNFWITSQIILSTVQHFQKKKKNQNQTTITKQKQKTTTTKTKQMKTPYRICVLPDY